jgi:hypothetical protein
MLLYSRTEIFSVREYNDDAHTAVNVSIAAQSAVVQLENENVFEYIIALP